MASDQQPENEAVEMLNNFMNLSSSTLRMNYMYAEQAALIFLSELKSNRRLFQKDIVS
jgi:hypothetical protein